MIPTKSNTAEKGCSPVSANCVIWQGPALTCINLQQGDSVTEVVHALATELCSLKDQLDLTDLDLKCLFEACMICPEPEKKLFGVLELLINKVCELEEALNGTGTENNDSEYITVAPCFQGADLDGDLIKAMPQTDYIKAIANKVCELRAISVTHSSTIQNHETRIVALEARPTGADGLPLLTPECIFGVDKEPKELDDLVDELEKQFCELKGALGEPTDMLATVRRQCVNLANEDAFSSQGTLGAITGWVLDPKTLSDSINNIWLTICDLRGTVQSVRGCCTKSCEDINFSYVVTLTDSGNTARLDFAQYTSLPVSFESCSNEATLRITDSTGKIFVTTIPEFGDKLTTSVSNNYYELDMTTTGLSAGSLITYQFVVETCFTNGVNNCNKIVSRTPSQDNTFCEIPTDVTASIVS